MPMTRLPNAMFLSMCALLSVLLVSCGDDSDADRDSGPSPVDTGPSDRDSGPSGMDSGPTDRDSGPTDRDSGPTTRDSGADAARRDAGMGMNVPGRHDENRVLGGLMRHFTVYVPDAVAGAVEAPVVFMIHGTGQTGEEFYESGEWRRRSDAEGIIVVYPDALTDCLYEDENGDGDFDDMGERHVTTKWSSGIFETDRFRICTPAEIASLAPMPRMLADHPLADDMAFFAEMIDILLSEYRIDTRRVYATGFSNGAQMSARLGAQMSDRFAAVHSQAGTLNVEPLPAALPISMAFTVGDRDDRFGASAAMPLPTAESVAMTPFFMRVAGEFRAVTQLEDAYTYSTTMAGMRTIGRFAFDTSSVGADNEFQVAIIEGCFHQYPNGDNHPLDITVPLWAFFESHPLH